jgi:hypothetical protein
MTRVLRRRRHGGQLRQHEVARPPRPLGRGARGRVLVAEEVADSVYRFVAVGRLDAAVPVDDAKGRGADGHRTRSRTGRRARITGRLNGEMGNVHRGGDVNDV